jgi:hypothetical protein
MSEGPIAWRTSDRIFWGCIGPYCIVIVVGRNFLHHLVSHRVLCGRIDGERIVVHPVVEHLK